MTHFGDFSRLAERTLLGVDWGHYGTSGTAVRRKRESKDYAFFLVP